MKALTIVLYDARTHEESRRLTQVFTRWGAVKAAIRFAREVDSQAMSVTEQETLAGLIAEAFDRRVEAEEIREGMSLAEMVTALNEILAKVARAGAGQGVLRQSGTGSSEREERKDLEEGEAAGDWMVELESSLVRMYGWSLHEIDETAVESLLPFVLRGTGGGDRGQGARRAPQQVYCDEVSWL
jgi:hypothetical protein